MFKQQPFGFFDEKILNNRLEVEVINIGVHSLSSTRVFLRNRLTVFLLFLCRSGPGPTASAGPDIV